MEVQLQLAIFLCRLGWYGNGASVEETAEWGGVAVGSVYNCTCCCQVAVIGCHDTVVRFSDQEQLQGAKTFSQAKAGTPAWQHGALAVDGTPIKLLSRPKLIWQMVLWQR